MVGNELDRLLGWHLYRREWSVLKSEGETPLVSLDKLQQEKDVSMRGGIFLDGLGWCVVHVWK